MNSKYISKDKLKQIPELPGIYKMLNSRGSIIYIGKSKCLRKRVQSYFVSTPKWDKVNRMVSLIKDIEYIVTDTHLEARLLECELIKEYKPPFNAQMKNDQGYFFIKIEKYNKNNPLSITDNRTEDSFGPFRSRYSMNEFLGRLKNLYPIVKNGSNYEFEYSMFPVQMDETTFNLNRSILLELFTDENNIDYIIQALQTKLDEAVIAYKYEAASIYRDMIISFKSIKNGLNGYRELLSRNIFLKLPINNGGYKLFYIVNGLIINNMVIDKLSQTQTDIFIRESKLKQSDISPAMPNEKSWIDYRDIMFSEILNLPDEMVELL
jgi:excinuclease ABC subunit C